MAAPAMYSGIAERPVLVVEENQLFGAALSIALQVRGLAARRLPPAAVDRYLAGSAPARPGLAIIDLDAGLASGRPSATRLVGAFRRAGWKVLVVSESQDEVAVEVAAAIAGGAVGSLCKTTTSFDRLVHAVTAALQDRAVMSAFEQRRWLEHHRQIREWEDGLDRLLGRLSNREREVLELLAEGVRAAAIAERWVVSITTVRTQIRAILAKLEVNSQLEAVALLCPPAAPHRPPVPEAPARLVRVPRPRVSRARVGSAAGSGRSSSSPRP